MPTVGQSNTHIITMLIIGKSALRCRFWDTHYTVQCRNHQHNT